MIFIQKTINFLAFLLACFIYIYMLYIYIYINIYILIIYICYIYLYIIYVCMKSMIFKVEVHPLLLVPADPFFTRPERDFNTPFTVVIDCKEGLANRFWVKGSVNVYIGFEQQRIPRLLRYCFKGQDIKP